MAERENGNQAVCVAGKNEDESEEEEDNQIGVRAQNGN